MLDLIEIRWEITMITTTGAKSDYFLEFCQFTSDAVELTALTDGRTVNDSVYLVVFGCVGDFSDQIANSRSRSVTWVTIKLLFGIFPFPFCCRPPDRAYKPSSARRFESQHVRPETLVNRKIWMFSIFVDYWKIDETKWTETLSFRKVTGRNLKPIWTGWNRISDLSSVRENLVWTLSTFNDKPKYSTCFGTHSQVTNYLLYLWHNWRIFR